MTKRERYLKALRGEPVDQLVWAPNFDYWLSVNKAEGTLPAKFSGMSRNDIVRAIGGTIWNRVGGVTQVRDPSVKELRVTDPQGNVISTLATPLGTIRAVYSATMDEGCHRAAHQSEHYIKDLESLRIMQYVVAATHYEPDTGPAFQALQETGADGIVLNQCFCVPFIQFAKTDVGYVNGFYMWMDYREEVDGLIRAYFDLFLQGYSVLADGPVDVISTGDNMDGTMISPDIFKEYAVPFYQAAHTICASRNKIFEGHWCGRTQTLLPLVPGCGLDVVEAVVTRPMADVSLGDALDLLRGEVVLQGGMPAVLVCNEGGSYADFERYVREVIRPLRGRRGFILGMSDNVPPNADFTRVEVLADLIA